jgi:hypothetical protein
MKSQNERITDAKISASVITRLAKALKSIQKESITPEELMQMAKLIIARVQS